MQLLSQAVAAYQANPSDQAAQVVKEARQTLADSGKPLVAEFNCRVLLEYPLAHPVGDAAIAERELLMRVNNFIDAVLDQEAAESGLPRDAGGEDRRRLRTQLVTFLNAHGRPLPALGHWPAGNAANASLRDMILSARDYYDATQPAETLGDTTVAQYQQRSQDIAVQARETASQWEAALAPIPLNLADVADIAVVPVVTPRANPGDAISNRDHLAHASGMPEAATNADIWWQMLSKPGNDVCAGFELAEASRTDYLQHLQNFCGTDINLNRLVALGHPQPPAVPAPEFPQVVQQMLRVVIQQQHGIYPTQLQAQLASYKQALATYINAPDDAPRNAALVALHEAYTDLTVSISPDVVAAFRAEIPVAQQAACHFPVPPPHDYLALDIDSSNEAELDNPVVHNKDAWFARYQCMTDPVSRTPYVNSGQYATEFTFADQLDEVARKYNIQLNLLHVYDAPGSEQVCAVFLQAFSLVPANHNFADPLPPKLEATFKAVADYVQQVGGVLGAPTGARHLQTDPGVLQALVKMQRHPRLQAHLQQQVAKQIMQRKALDTFLQQQHPSIEPEQMDLLRMQVLQYVQKFGITRFDFPTAETLANAADAASPSYAEAKDVVDQWQGVVGQAIAYDATLIAGRRLGVAHDDAAWVAFAAAPLSVPAGALGLSAEIKSVMRIPSASLARMLAVPGETMAPADQLDQRLTQMFTQDLPAPYAPPELAADVQPHALLARLDGQGAHGADHAAARAHIIRAVLLTHMARHAGVTLNDAAQEYIATVLQATHAQLDAGGAIDISADSDALLTAYVIAADANPSLKALLVPAPEQATAAERLAQLRTQQAGRPADVYEGIDPRPGTEAYRHHVLQQMRHDAADAAGGLDATQQVPNEDITDAEDLDALRRRTAADHALSEEQSLRQQVIDKYRMHLRFLDDNGDLTADLKAMFVDNLIGGSEPRAGYEHYPEGHEDKDIVWNETLPTGFRLNVDRCTVNTLYFEPPVHSTQSGLSVMRSVGTDGGVTFKIAELGTGGANNTAKARIYAAMLAREFYRKDKDGKMHAVGIDVKAFKAKDIFGDNCGLSESEAQKTLQDALQAFHIANEDMVVGKGKLYFADDPSKKPKPKETKEQKPQPPAQRNAATDWLDTLTDTQMPAQDRADARIALQNAPAEQVSAFMSAQPAQRIQQLKQQLPQIRQRIQQARQQQAAANGGAQPPAGGRAAPPPPDGAAAAGPTP